MSEWLLMCLRKAAIVAKCCISRFGSIDTRGACAHHQANACSAMARNRRRHPRCKVVLLQCPGDGCVVTAQPTGFKRWGLVCGPR